MSNQLYAKLGESGMLFDKPHRTPQGYIKMVEDRPTTEHVAQTDGTWAIPELTPEEIAEQKANDYKAMVDPETNHVMKHRLLGEDEQETEAQLLFEIAHAKFKEKYKEGITVWITENGTHYHNDETCSHIGLDDNNEEINLSDGLKNYTACSYCVTN